VIKNNLEILISYLQSKVPNKVGVVEETPRNTAQNRGQFFTPSWGNELGGDSLFGVNWSPCLAPPCHSKGASKKSPLFYA